MSEWPAPEADEREVLARVISANVDDGPTYTADAILAAGFRRSQPAPRTVSAESVRAAVERLGAAPTWLDGEIAYQAKFLAALGITVEAPRG